MPQGVANVRTVVRKHPDFLTFLHCLLTLPLRFFAAPPCSAATYSASCPRLTLGRSCHIIIMLEELCPPVGKRKKPTGDNVPRGARTMKKVIARLMRRWRYLRTWGTPIGKDCISLDTSLCRWLGTRLLFLADHTHGAPCGYMGSSWEDEDGTGYEQWKKDLAGAGNALLAWGNRYEEKYDEEHIYTPAQLALRWVAQNLANLWD